MKVLILSCNTGQGHNAAGKAILENLTQRGIACEMADALAFAGDKVSKITSDTYVKIATASPSVFHFLYKAGDRISSDKHKSIVYLANSRYAEPMYRYITENGFDTVITPHLFPAETLTYLKRKRGLSINTFAVATDYTCIPFWEETNLDSYFIPHRDLIEEFREKGIPAEKLIPTGIPVSKCFRDGMEQPRAKRQLGYKEEERFLLVMTGSMGFGNVKELTSSLLQKFPESVKIVVLGGNNEKMKQGLRASFETERVQVMDFTDQVSLFMDACDLLFTKPGGLTSTEAAVKNVPFLHTAPIPGCETINAAFFEERGLSICAEKPEDLSNMAYSLWTDREKRNRMRENQRREINPNACDDICDFIIKQAESRESLR